MSTTPSIFPFRRPARSGAFLLLATLALAGCGGGGGSATPAAAAGCSLDAQKADLRATMERDYLWYAQLQSPDPAGFGSLAAYLGGLRSAGVPGNPAFPPDRWSGLQPTESFQRFFGDGQSLGYGLSVAGLEVSGTGQPLRVRYVEPRSPAAAAGVQRGDTLLLADGRAVADLTRASDFSWLETDRPGSRLSLRLRGLDGAERTVELVSAVHDLQPVSVATVLRSPRGRSAGYLVLKDFIGTSSGPLDAAFAQFRAAGVQELVLDLRYNGGGLVQLAADLASRIQPLAEGRTFTRLVYSDRRSGSNLSYAFNRPQQSVPGLTRVYVLTGARTCSASELLVNGLRPVVEVVQVGATTCGKPVGFQPRDNGCGVTVSQVNFEVVNADGQGRYWDGIVPRCAAAEDWNQPLGDPTERLTAVALAHADTGNCPTVANDRLAPLQARAAGAVRSGAREPGDWQGMVR